MDEKESCMYCKHKDPYADGTRRSFKCWRNPAHTHIDDFPQNYTCGEHKATKDPYVIKREKPKLTEAEKKVEKLVNPPASGASRQEIDAIDAMMKSGAEAKNA